MVELPTLGGCRSHARAVNDRGEVAGESLIAGDNEWHGFYWTAKGGMVDLGTKLVNVIAVTKFGEVIGNGVGGADGSHVFSWTANTGIVDLGPGQALAVNDRGDIVGSDSGELGFPLHYQALLWKR